eukprot:831954-Pyramimonas_sp.AAC.1
MEAGNRIQFTPLSGVHSETPLAYLLEIDDFKILLDCGWNDKLDVADVQPIVEYAHLLNRKALFAFPSFLFPHHTNANCNLESGITYQGTQRAKSSLVKLLIPQHRLAEQTVGPFVNSSVFKSRSVHLFAVRDNQSTYSLLCPTEQTTPPCDEHWRSISISESKLLGCLVHPHSRIPEIDAVLLSHSDTTHLGALPYLVGKKGLKAPVYATLPVHKMGQMYMYDHYLSRQVGSPPSLVLARGYYSSSTSHTPGEHLSIMLAPSSPHS